MSEPEDGTTDFKLGSLRELLDEEEKAKAPKGGGPGINRQVLIGGGVAVVIVIILAVVLLSGGKKSKTPAGDKGKTFAVNVRSTVLTGEMVKNTKVSVCGTANEPLAEDVLILNRTTSNEIAGLAQNVKLEVSATPDEQAKLVAYRLKVGEINVFPLPKCPASAVTTTTPATEAPTQPPTSTPPASG